MTSKTQHWNKIKETNYSYSLVPQFIPRSMRLVMNIGNHEHHSIGVGIGKTLGRTRNFKRNEGIIGCCTSLIFLPMSKVAGKFYKIIHGNRCNSINSSEGDSADIIVWVRRAFEGQGFRENISLGEIEDLNFIRAWHGIWERYEETFCIGRDAWEIGGFRELKGDVRDEFVSAAETTDCGLRGVFEGKVGDCLVYRFVDDDEEIGIDEAEFFDVGGCRGWAETGVCD